MQCSEGRIKQMNAYNKKYQTIEIYGLLFIDIVCMTFSYFLAYLLRFHGVNGPLDRGEILQIYFPFVIICLVYNLMADGYRHFFQRGYFLELVQVVKYNLCLLIATGFYIYVFRLELEFSRLLLGYFVLINMIVTYAVRIAFKWYMNTCYKRSKESDKFLIVTTQTELPNVIKHIEKDAGWSYEITGIALMDADMTGQQISGFTVMANRSNVVEVARQSAVDVVFIHCPGETREELQLLVQSFVAMGIVCHNCVDRLELDIPCSNVGKFADFPIVTYSINTIDYRRRLIKRMIDIVGSIIGLAFTTILTPFVAIAIKLETRGPVFFTQVRIGKNGRRFKMYKFRSMYTDAEERKGELIKDNEVTGLMFKMGNDPRITKVGRFLRKTSIDEMPQFFNVLKGDMSLVGTRPPTVDEFEQYNVYYRRRLSITPGLTGMWQVSGRSDITDFDEVVKLDLEYIDNWSLKEDLKIMIRTIGVVLFGRGSK
jgi:exopolysaccharide biosynthesis polyprenyl glycosylphosphotransferase